MVSNKGQGDPSSESRPGAHRTQLPGRRDCGAVTPLEGPGLPWRQLCVVGQWHRNRSARQRGTQVREEADSPPGVHGPGVGGLNCCAHSGPAAASATLPTCLDGSHTQGPIIHVPRPRARSFQWRLGLQGCIMVLSCFPSGKTRQQAPEEAEEREGGWSSVRMGGDGCRILRAHDALFPTVSAGPSSPFPHPFLKCRLAPRHVCTTAKGMRLQGWPILGSTSQRPKFWYSEGILSLGVHRPNISCSGPVCPGPMQGALTFSGRFHWIDFFP